MLLSELKISDESIPQEPQAIENPVSAYLSLKLTAQASRALCWGRADKNE